MSVLPYLILGAGLATTIGAAAWILGYRAGWAAGAIQTATAARAMRAATRRSTP